MAKDQIEVEIVIDDSKVDAKLRENQTKFNSFADEAAKSSKVVTTATEGTAEAAEKASVASEVMAGNLEGAVTQAIALNTAVISIGAILAAGVVSILAAKKLSEDILKNAKERLEAETAITAAWNKRALTAKADKDFLLEAAEDRSFDRFADQLVKSSNAVALAKARDSLQAEFDAASRELQARNVGPESVASALGIRNTEKDKALDRFLKNTAETDAEREIRERRRAQLNRLNADIENVNNRITPSPSAKLFDEIAIEAIKNRVKAAQEAARIEMELAQRRDAFNLDSVKSLTELKKFHFKSVAQNALEAFDQEVAIARKREELVKKAADQAKEYARDVKKAYKDVADAQKQVIADYASTINNRISAVNLRDEARQFRAGKLDVATPEGFQQKIQAQLEAVGFSRYNAPWFDQSGRLIQQRIDALDAERSAARDRAIIGITSGVDPERLTSGQRDIAAGARLREADRLDKEKTEGIDALKEAVAELKKLNASGSLQVRIVNEAPDRAKVETRPKKAATQNYYAK